MALFPHILIVLVIALGTWTTIGLAVAPQNLPPTQRIAAAPVIGWAVHSSLALPLHMLLGMSRTAIMVQFAVSLLAAGVVFIRRIDRSDVSSVPPWTYAAAVFVALAPAIAVFPKPFADGVALASPIFDHSKVAIIDEIIRNGAIPNNPFFGSGGDRLSYYYLWHFSAAELAVLIGVSSWEADAGLSWFTAAGSLLLMMGLAVWMSGRAASAAIVLLLAMTASARPVLAYALGRPAYEWLLQEASGFGGWLFQSSWAPQHLMSASCAIVATILLTETSLRNRSGILLLGLIAAAAFECSVWIGGVTFALASAAAAAMLLPGMMPKRRIEFIAGVLCASLLTALISSPMLRDQYMAAVQRGGCFPFALQSFWVFGDTVPFRRPLDVPGFWLIHLVVELPAIYPIAVCVIVLMLGDRMPNHLPKPITAGLLSIVACGLVIAAFGVSTVGINNDLAWRAALPAAMIMIVFAAAGISDWVARPKRLGLATAALGLGLGTPEGFQIIRQNAFPNATESARAFAKTPEMWATVRRHAGPFERVANNPYFQRDLTPWPINIAWALMSDRRSCYAGLEFAIPFTRLNDQQRNAIDAQFKRVFEGRAEPADVNELADRYGCTVAVVAAADGAWISDPFATSSAYRLVEEERGAWRIYRFDRDAKAN
ncbi:hypothetical protein GJW-30_1_01112 [Variibacter gotjawalensis]|uniref:Glycosyltransferase RgtA/B/C/D-like domain-containing protein n=1 Tax=Variibacter gotjawalensis TaxID=1333996 RepID=A0A0S3PRM3_9BRAD|nr:hypothetical protein [Variibacter gotjawalensis]NIK48896.1 hypothetical protein [Variibacter gotjawalensis]RZS50751.1 hypothetical protein EV661_3221 [Variibacter gotjawalensis]BAT58586.1 hypothetical protein GJW-30_1_01112 [Variibacter gotjawalensis]